MVDGKCHAKRHAKTNITRALAIDSVQSEESDEDSTDLSSRGESDEETELISIHNNIDKYQKNHMKICESDINLYVNVPSFSF